MESCLLITWNSDSLLCTVHVRYFYYDDTLGPDIKNLFTYYIPKIHYNMFGMPCCGC